MFWILIGYLFLFIHRPFEVWPSLGTYHIERIYMLTAMSLWLVTAGKRWLSNPLHAGIAAFAAAMLLSWVMSPWASHCQHTVEDYFKLLVFYVLLVTVVHDERRLRLFVLAYLAVMAIYMGHSLLEYVNGRHAFRMGIVRLIGVDSSLGDPNSFGSSIVYSLPLVVPFWICNRTGWLRWFVAGYVVLAVSCILLTGSRGSFVGMLLVGLIVIFGAKGRGWLLALALLMAPVVWAVLPGSLQNRFETIINPAAGPREAYASGEGRKEGLLIGLKLWEENPVTGCGAGAWKAASGRKTESHNLYGQLLGEMGTVGAAAFALLLWGYWSSLRRIKQEYRRHPEWGHDFVYHLSRAVGLSLVMMLFIGNFAHNLYRYNWLWLAAFLVIARYCVQLRLQGAVAQPAPAPRPWIGHAIPRPVG